MKTTEFDADEILTDFLSDYIDHKLEPFERDVFEEYLAENIEERSFARKAVLGKKALNRLAAHYNCTTGSISKKIPEKAE